jgi:hypothetical protein
VQVEIFQSFSFFHIPLQFGLVQLTFPSLQLVACLATTTLWFDGAYLTLSTVWFVGSFLCAATVWFGETYLTHATVQFIRAYPYINYSLVLWLLSYTVRFGLVGLTPPITVWLCQVYLAPRYIRF